MTASEKWLMLFVDIVIYELNHLDDGELLSEHCDRWIERRPLVARASILAAGSLLTLHLANILRPSCDPIAKEFWRRRRNGLLKR